MPAPVRKLRGSRSPTEIDKLIGTNLRRLRCQRDMSLKDLADHLGISHQQLQKYETGVNRLSAGMIPLVADALGVQLDALYDNGTRPTRSVRKTDQLRAECEKWLQQTKSEDVLKTMARVLRVLATR